jgi:hypothetical protein
MTIISIVVLLTPAEFAADIVWLIGPYSPGCEPLIIPVEEFKINPMGKVGKTVHESGPSPEKEGMNELLIPVCKVRV